jgi:protein TonB
METADTTTLALDERLVPPADKSQWAFRAALTAAFLLHAAFFIEIGRSVPRSVGAPTGAQDAIAVDLVTEADLKSRESVAMPPAGAPAPPPAAQPQPQPQPEPQPQPTPEPQAEQPTPPQPQPEQATPTPPPATPAEPAPKDTAQQKAPDVTALPDFESFAKDLATTPQPKPEAKAQETETKPKEAEPAEAKEPSDNKKATEPAEKQKQAAPAKKKPAPQAKLDLRMPDASSAPPGRSAAASRPPGITRSGENDDFGRAVVRALRQTMPPPQGTYGVVAVRLILTENGDLASVDVIEKSGTNLDQNVAFAIKQTYFPLPPYKATLVDRTFYIRYIYRRG